LTFERCIHIGLVAFEHFFDVEMTHDIIARATGTWGDCADSMGGVTVWCGGPVIVLVGLGRRESW